MKKDYRAFGIILLAVSFIQFTSCKKIIDKYFPGHAGDPKVEDYRISKLAFTYRARPTGAKQSGIVYYNQQNNPDSIIFDGALYNEVSDGSMFQSCYFNYNASDRLESTVYNGQSGYQVIHKYIYNDQGKIIADSTRFIEPDPTGAVAYPEYDDQGRVSKEIAYTYEGGGRTYYDDPIKDSVIYNYDADGNLMRKRDLFGGIPEDVAYDDKISYLRTNEIWMFISRNYSRNNPDRVDSYNEIGLPLGFRNGVVISFLGYGDPYEIEYEKIK